MKAKLNKGTQQFHGLERQPWRGIISKVCLSIHKEIHILQKKIQTLEFKKLIPESKETII